MIWTRKYREQKCSIPKRFELGKTMSYSVWSIVHFPPKLGLKINTFLTLMGTRPGDKANVGKS